MEVKRLTESVEIIQQLGDNPGTDNGLSTSELRAKFDESAKIIKKYINEVLCPAIEAGIDEESLRQMIDEVLSEQLEEAYSEVNRIIDERLSNARHTYPATIGTNWVGESAPFTQEISVPGLLEDDVFPKIDMAASDDVQTAENETAAYGYFYRFEALDDILKVYSFEKTDAKIKVNIEVLRL